jgi:CheY-like chemotaxis protein
MNRPRPRVLLADDYPELLAIFERWLTPSYDVVGCVTDGTALIDAAARLQPDVIVTDLFMHRSNGLEACRRIKATLPAAKIIIVSVTADIDITDEALRAGASAFVSKIRAADELLPAIQRALAAGPSAP